MTQALDAAWDAVHAAMNAGEVTNCLSCETCPSMPCACAEDLARAALRAALPAEPTREMIAAIDDARGIEAYREIRAQVLGEDA